ncbi:MAG: DUF342 domain-containing protein [Planctomycetes bacterium]|nr:DUF342 domain-containing protein [Planctomycetota bacterium]
MDRLRIQIADDGLTATVLVAAGAPFTREELASALTAAGVRHGIDQDVCAALVAAAAEPTFATGPRPVATGKSPIPGQPGRIDLQLRQGPLPGTQRSDGSMDFRERHRLLPVRVGDVLATEVPPTRGTDGRDVRDRPLPAADGGAAHTVLGPGAARRGDGAIVATRDGVLLASPDQRLDVVPHWAHRGDVDLRSGNLRTHGSMEVQGDVSPTMAVHADGDLVIHGAVLDAKVTAGGDVAVRGGILGEGAVVDAGGDLECRHATAAQLSAGQLVLVHDQIAGGRVRAGTIVLDGGRGHAFGGELRARGALQVRQAGSAAGARTLLAVADLTNEQQDLARLETRARTLQRGEPGRRDDGRGKGGKSARRSLTARDEAMAERLRLAQRQRQLLAGAELTIVDTAWPGVLIRFGERTLTLMEATHRTRFRWHAERADIVQEPLP